MVHRSSRAAAPVRAEWHTPHMSPMLCFLPVMGTLASDLAGVCKARYMFGLAGWLQDPRIWGLGRRPSHEYVVREGCARKLQL